MSHRHDNDTLNGRLLAYEREDEKHLRHRFGYWRMVEERMVREELIKEGIEPTYQAVQRRIEHNHGLDAPYYLTSRKVAVNAQSASGAAAQQAAHMTEGLIEDAREEVIAAMRKIAAGHNDPRSLAEEVLAKLDSRSLP